MIIIGTVIFLGLLFGEIAEKLKLPKVTGYILAGVALNPGLVNFVPPSAIKHSNLITNIALTFITFSVGGTLLYSNIRKLGKGILYITAFEAEFAFAAVIAGFLTLGPFFIHEPNGSWIATIVPLAILMGVLASPTDPSATLAVVHEYRARGPVATTIMSVAAFDDIAGIINYSIGITLAASLSLHKNFSLQASVFQPIFAIGGAILLGSLFGSIFNFSTLFFKRETDGFFIVLIFALLPLCFGIATSLGLAELLATMVMGIIVVNYNVHKEKIFRVLERYTEQLIFVIFFSIGGMQLNFSVLSRYFPLIILFVIFRSLGKISGAMTGAAIAGAEPNVRKYTPAGLIPQGGIVIGLALLIKQNPAFKEIGDIIVSVAIGAAIIHELVGPVLSEMTLKRAGEIRVN